MRYIECTVRNEFVSGAGQVAGAAGSHHDVSLRLTFGPMWDGLNKYVTFRDALGENPTVEMILPTMLVEDTTYDVVVPAAAKAKQGKMMVTVSGFTVVDGVEEATATMTTTAYFTVLPSDYAMLDDESIDATLAEQLEAEINAIGTGIEEALNAAGDAEAWAVGQIDGVDVPNTDPRYENNSKYYAQQADEYATDAATEAETAEAWATGGTEGTPSATNNAKYYSEQSAGEVENSEAWASGTRGGTPVTSGDPAYENNSKYYKDQAADQVTLAEAQVTAAEGKATLSESWAVGGTNTRTGEDTNNAKYWSEQAQAAAGGGVTSFNGRTGVVLPQSGDYDAAMVGARASDWMPSANDVGAAAQDDLAPVEAASTASQAYAVNSFLVYNGQLYRVTAAIAPGDTLTVGTNIAAADVGTYLAMIAAAPNAGGFAPAGYGLGVAANTLTIISDTEAISASGWYYAVNGTTANMPTTRNGIIRADVYNQNWIALTMFYNTESPLNFVECRRVKTMGTWQPWEYVNPPLVAGTEYRTTERYLGKPVYVKVVDCGAVPNNTATATAHGVANCIPLRIFGTFDTPGTIPYTNSSNQTIDIAANSTNIIIKSNANFSSATAKAVFFYTKSTD